MSTLSAVLIVLNERNKIEACLKSLAWANEIVVVDGGSVDGTADIVRRYTDKVFSRKFDDFSSQKNYAVSCASSEWILSVDADEIVSPELRQSIQSVLKEESDFDGFMIERTNKIFGKELRFGGQGKEKILRLFRKGKGTFKQPIHEELVVPGPCGYLAGELVHESTQTEEEYRKKLALYTTFEARNMATKGVSVNLYHLWVQPILRFIYNYLFRLGFLDGITGLRYQIYSSYYHYLKYKKLKELKGKPSPHPLP